MCVKITDIFQINGPFTALITKSFLTSGHHFRIRPFIYVSLILTVFDFSYKFKSCSYFEMFEHKLFRCVRKTNEWCLQASDNTKTSISKLGKEIFMTPMVSKRLKITFGFLAVLISGVVFICCILRNIIHTYRKI